MVATKTAPLEKKQACIFMKNFLQQFQEACNQQNSPKASQLEQFLSKNFQLTSNGQQMSKNLHDYMQRLEQLRKQYSNIKISDFQEEPFVAENKMVLQYTLELTSRNAQSKDQRHVFIMALANIEDHKITHWSQVTHEKGSNHWDS